MSSHSVSTSSGTDTVVLADGSIHVHHGNHAMPPEPAFVIGMMAGALLTLLAQRGRRARQGRRAGAAASTDRFDQDVQSLAQRTATLERIVTDPGKRLADEIDRLR